MKLIVIKPYWIEDHYECQTVTPVEYASIESLKDFIRERVKYLNNVREDYVKARDLHNKACREYNLKTGDELRALTLDYTNARKARNRLYDTKKIDRTEDWAANVKKMNDDIDAKYLALKQFDANAPCPPDKPDFSITIGSETWEHDFYSPEYIDKIKILTLEDWLKSHGV